MPFIIPKAEEVNTVLSIVINTVPFRSERSKFFVPVCKPVPETPSFHLGSDFEKFRSVPVNFGQFRPVSADFGRNLRRIGRLV